MRKWDEILNFKERLSYHIFLKEPSWLLPSIALQALTEGYETPSLIILAGLSENEDSYIIDKYFNDALKELNFSFPDKNLTAEFLTNLFFEKIAHNKINTFDGCQFVFENILDSTEARKKDKSCIYSGIGLAKIYGLYITIWDLRNADSNWNTGKTNQRLIEEVALEIKKEISDWLKQNFNQHWIKD